MIAYLRAAGLDLGMPATISARRLAAGCAAAAAAGALAESLPAREVDNVTVPLAAGLVAHAALV